MKNYDIGYLKPEEIDSLLALQRENLAVNLDLDTLNSQGYVSFQYDPAIILLMMNDEPQIIARADNQVVGYALVATIFAMSTIEKALPMIEMIATLDFKGKPCREQQYYIVGQVCVKAGYRGMGVLEAIYAEHRKAFADRYDFAVTEVAVDNGRSLAAHHRIGFKTIHVFYDDFNGKEWHIIAWDFLENR